MKSINGYTVGRRNFTLRDYYKAVLKASNNNDALSDDEKEAINWLNIHDICICGHEKQNHSKFLNGLFVGCQCCKCEKFTQDG